MSCTTTMFADARTAPSTSISIAGKPSLSGEKQRTESSGVRHDSGGHLSGPQQSSSPTLWWRRAISFHPVLTPYSCRPTCRCFPPRRRNNRKKEKEKTHGKDRGTFIRHRRVSRVRDYDCLCNRLCHRTRGAEDDRLRACRRADRLGHDQLAADVAVCNPAQRHGETPVQEVVDSHRADRGGTQHLRAFLKPRAHVAVLAMAADAGSGMAGDEPAHRRVAVRPELARLGPGLRQHLLD